MTLRKNYADTLTVTNPEYEGLVAKIAELEERKISHTNKINALQAYQESAVKLDAINREEKEKFSSDDLLMLEGLNWLFVFHANRESSVDAYLRDTRHRLRNVIRLLAEKKELLSEMKGEVNVVKLSVIKDKLQRIDFLKPKSIKLYTQARNQFETTENPWLTFVTAPVLCTVNESIQDFYSWLSTPHDKPSIRIGSAKVSINLCTGKLIVAPAMTRNAAERQRFVTGYNNSAVHPHCLGEHEPCLGDFTGPFREAVADKDWVYMATIIGLFLANTAWEDSAGRYFNVAYGNILARMENASSKFLYIDGNGYYTPPKRDVDSKVLFEEMDVPGDYLVTINDKAYKYQPSIGYMEKVEET